MLNHTKEAVLKIIEDFKKLGFSFTVGANAAYIGYLIYAITTSRGELWVNIPLLVFSVLYLGFYLYATQFGKELNGKNDLKKTAKRLFSHAKKLMKAYTFAVMLYSLTSVGKGADAFYVILMALQIMFFLLQIVFDIIVRIIEKYADIVKTAVTMDIDQITKPVKSVTTFFKKMTGKEVDVDPAEPTKTQEMLTARVQTAKEKKAQEKEEKRLEKELLKQQKRELKKGVSQTSNSTIGDSATDCQPEQAIELTEEAAFSTAEAIPEPPKKKGFFHKK